MNEDLIEKVKSDAAPAPTPTIIKNIFEKWKILNFKPPKHKSEANAENVN